MNKKTWESEPDYSKWTIDADPSIQADNGGYGVELTSPILSASVRSRFVAPGEWKTDIEKMWDALLKNFDVVTEYRHHCGTHIHISPLGGFDVEQVRSFACFITCLSDMISEEIPLERRQSRFAMPNFRVKTKPSLDKLAPGTPIAEAIELMMPTVEDALMADTHRKFVAWNFLPLLVQGTIEFRQPPHVKSLEEALHWVTKALCFGRQGLRWTC